jgi:hypothetical protein
LVPNVQLLMLKKKQEESVLHFRKSQALWAWQG